MGKLLQKISGKMDRIAAKWAPLGCISFRWSDLNYHHHTPEVVETVEERMVVGGYCPEGVGVGARSSRVC